MPKNKMPSKVTVEELEPRILFSAGLEGIAHISLADESVERVLNIEELSSLGMSPTQPVKQEAINQNIIARANSTVLGSTYYLDDISGVSDKPVGNLKVSTPTDATLEDYDSDGEEGLRIDEGGSGASESDGQKFQTWLVDASNETLQGAVNLNIWTAMKDFVTDKGGRVDVFLIDSDSSGNNATVIASDSLQRADWDIANSATWIEDSFDFGNVDYTFAAGRFLGVKLIVHSSSDDHMMFAYDTTTYAARLTVTAAINTVVVDTEIDEDNGDTSSIAALIADPGGAGISLREAIEAANSTANGASPDRIHFEIAGTPSIALGGDLPAITEAVVIDGTTDSDFATNSTPVIEIDGAGILNLGLHITGDDVIVRGLAINSFDSHGIEITGNNNRIESSYIGIQRDGTSAAGNSGLGIRINNAQNNQIGAPDAGNVISGNALSGIAIVGAASANNIIESNRIGTNANGTAALANGDYGIDLWDGGANNNRIGGDTLAQRNVISWNAWAGIHISGGSGNIVSGNYIGSNGTGASASNNGGIDIDGNSSGNQIGGTGPGEGNIIALNTGAGVKVSDTNSIRNTIHGNEIYDNTDKGIAHLSNGNDNREAPQLSIAAHDAVGNLSIFGSYSAPSLSNDVISVDYFSNTSSELEGRTYLGSDSITLDGSGNAVIEHSLTASVSTGEFLSATATDSAGNTSEFSANAQIQQALVVVASADTYVDDSSKGNNYGESSSLRFDSGGGDFGKQHILLQFDVDALPGNATITNANLYLEATSNSGSTDIQARLVTELWSEGGQNGSAGAASWNDRENGIAWSNRGNPQASTTLDTVNTSAIGRHEWNVTSAVQGWHSGSVNKGLVIGTDATGSEQVVYQSVEAASSAPPRLIVEFTVPVNNKPTINNLNGDAITVTNDGVFVKIDTNLAADLVDPDSASDFDGGYLEFVGSDFAVQDTISVDTTGTISLSAGIADGSIVSVGASAVGTISNSSSSGFRIDLNGNSNDLAVDELLRNAQFATDSMVLGSRSVAVEFDDGDGDDSTTAIDTVTIVVAETGTGLVTTAEDTTYPFAASDFDFTGVVGSNLATIEILSLPVDGVLERDGVAVSIGDVISKSDIDSGLFTYTPPLNESGASLGVFDFQVNNGLLSVSILAGEVGSTLTTSSFAATDAMLENTDNFGLGGTVPTAVNLVLPSANIDAAYLAQGDIFFDGGNTDSDWTPTELDALQNWVLNGGILISANDRSDRDAVANDRGILIPSPGSASQTWTIADAGSEIIDGPFGLVGNNGDNFNGAATLAFFDSSSFNGGDQVIVNDSVSGEATVILRQHGNGWILFSGDEGVFRGESGSSVTTTRDRFIANTFAWAIDQLPGTASHTMNVTVNAQNDTPQLTLNSLSLSEGDTVTLDSNDLAATDVDNNNGDLVFNFQAVNGGFFELSSNPGNEVSSATQLQVTTSQLRFVHDGEEPEPSYSVSVTDGTDSSPVAPATITYSNVNDAPAIIANSLTLSEGQTVVISSSDLAANDPDNNNADLVLSFSNVVAGHFARASAPSVAVTSVLQSQIAASELVFVHDGSETAAAYEVTASDSSPSSSPSNAATVSFSNINDAPRIDNLNGNSAVAINDGSDLLIDTDVPASVFDADLPTDIDGAMLSVQGTGFDSLDKLYILTDSNVTLSSGMSNGSQVSVAGSVVANLSSVSVSGFIVNFISPATTADADAIVSRLGFSSTASLLGNRDIEVQYSDGIDTSDIANASVLLTSPISGVVSGTEDESYVFTQADFDFTGVIGSDVEVVEILSLPAEGLLTLNDVAVSVGQLITPAQIISGELEFTPALDANGNSYTNFNFQINNGIVSTNVLTGQDGSPETIEVLQASSNFGLGGVYPTGVNILSPNGAIDGDYLDQGSILLDSSFNEVGWSNAQLSLLDTWVRDGGVLIASSDNLALDDIADFYGLEIGGNSASTWDVAFSSHPIFNGRFGSVGPNGTSLITGGATASYFRTSSLAAGDVVLARDSASNEPTLVLRQLGAGWILFTGDENVFDSAMTGGGVVNTVNDRFSANVFDWAIDQLPAEDVHTLNVSIAAVNDLPTVINGNAVETFTEDTPLDLVDIIISDIDSATVNAKLVLSAPGAGVLSTGSTGSASSTYDATSGVWSASGNTSDVNVLLENLQYTPTENFEQNFTLNIDINDGSGTQVSSIKRFVAVPVNDDPVADPGGPYSITEGEGVSFDGSGSYDVDAGDSLQVFQWDLLKDGNVLASDVNSALSWNQLVSHGVNDDGAYQVRLTVVDESGAKHGEVSALDVANLDPVFNINGAALAYQDDTYELSLEAIDPGDDPINQWVIDWGDGTVQSISGSESSAAHAYSIGGISPTISILADTDEGQYAAASLAINVVPNAAAQGEVLIDNSSPIEEDILTVSHSLTDEDGLSGSISYQWLRDGIAIDGADESMYVVTTDDIGSELSVTASYIDDRNTPETVSSTVTQLVQPKNRAASLILEIDSIEIEENNNASERTYLSEISVQDDDLGENTLSLSGDDADKFEIDDGVLYLKAGVELDYEEAIELRVQIDVDDAEVDGSPDDSATFTLNVGDIAQEFFIPLERVESAPEPNSNEDETETETERISEEQVAALEFVEDEVVAEERGELPGGTSSAFQQPIDVSGILSAVGAEQAAKNLFLERAEFSANAAVVNLADVIDLDSVEVRFAALNLLGELPGIDPMEDFSMLDNSGFTNGLDELRRGVESIDLSDKIVVGSSATVTTGLSIGYVLWMIRGSVLLSTILSSLPAWRLIDPLPVISGMLSDEDEDDESLESIIEDGSSSDPESESADDDSEIPDQNR
ncbi:MAG: cadherin-like domain-containing protein [Pseudomonadales bacterium]